MIIINGLKNILEALSFTPEFQKLAMNVVSGELKTGSSGVAKAAKQNAEWYADKMREIIEAYMDEHELVDYSDMSVNVAQLSDGTMSIEMSFSNTSNLSPSLNPNRGSIVLPRLLNTGFSTKSDIYGWWHGAFIHGLRNRDAEEFLQDAVHEFNELYGDEAIAEYHRQDAY